MIKPVEFPEKKNMKNVSGTLKNVFSGFMLIRGLVHTLVCSFLPFPYVRTLNILFRHAKTYL